MRLRSPAFAAAAFVLVATPSQAARETGQYSSLFGLLSATMPTVPLTDLPKIIPAPVAQPAFMVLGYKWLDARGIVETACGVTIDMHKQSGQLGQSLSQKTENGFDHIRTSFERNGNSFTYKKTQSGVTHVSIMNNEDVSGEVCTSTGCTSSWPGLDKEQFIKVTEGVLRDCERALSQDRRFPGAVPAPSGNAMPNP